ncbi:hypothetical protein Trydic_g4259 [Trypoxylus dichotomus]
MRGISKPCIAWERGWETMCTSMLQSIGQGVLENFKDNYRRILLEPLLEKINEGSYGLINSLKQINLKDIVYWATGPWNKLKESTIQTSWSKIIEKKDILDKENMDDDHNTMFELLQKLSDCEDATKKYFFGWLDGDEKEKMMTRPLMRLLNYTKHRAMKFWERLCNM